MYATAKDGQRFSPPIRVATLGSPKPSHPQIAIDAAGRIMIAWDEVVGGVRTAAGRLVSTKNGHIDFADIVRFADGASSYPVIAPTSKGWFAVWSTGGAASTVRGRLLP
jgi:hypothetical protein